MRADRLLAAGMQTLVQLVYPARCLSCGGIVETEFGMCNDCWADTHFNNGLSCDLCALPLSGGAQSDAYCDECLSAERPWSRGRAALEYRDNGRRLVLALKHGDRQDIARAAGIWMARASVDMVQEDMLVVPVPLHLHRHMARRYNQSALLAEGMAETLGLDWCPDALERRSATASLEGKSRDERYETVSGRISVPDLRTDLIWDRPVMIVDDVLTTGATLTAATEACFAAGATDVCVSVMARVVSQV